MHHTIVHQPYIQDSVSLCSPSSVGSLLFPSSSGFFPNKLPLSFGLTAYRCLFPAALSPPPHRRVLIFADSVLRPFSHLTWPSSYDVQVHCISGASLRRVVSSCVSTSSSFDVVIIHAGVNDVSRAGVSFESDFASSASSARDSLLSRFRHARIAFSLLCTTSSDVMNLRVAVANCLFRDHSCFWFVECRSSQHRGHG